MPEDTVVWAVGDIHGRLDLLEPLVAALIRDAQTSPARRKVVIFLGDYVDRGADSRGVLQFLTALSAVSGIDWRFLRGNHEHTMLAFLTDPSVGAQWCEYGGDATLKSYGLRPPNLKHKLEPWAHLSADLDHRMTAEERRFLEGLEMSVIVGDYFFVHAGVRPGVSLDGQSDEDLMWIRRTFLDSDVEFERVVVHGHTPTTEVHADRRRLGIDTKAYASGKLSAIRLEGTRRVLMQTQLQEGDQVSVVQAAIDPEASQRSAA